MPDPTSEGRSIRCTSVTHKQTPSLAELSSKDKPWDKHRANADTVANMYKGSKFNDYARRMTTCSELLDFKLAPDAAEGAYKLKLSNARFCRVRHCPVCQWRRSLMWKAKAFKVIPKVVQEYPTYRWLFLTLTVKNCPVNELKETLKKINKGFKRLTELKRWPGVGWIKSTEVTKGKNGPMQAHPHLHVLLMVKPAFFSRDYINQNQWSNLWQQCLRLEYQPMVHVRAIRRGNDPAVMVPEILKYALKESDLVRDRQWLIEVTNQLHRTRAVATGGVLKEYLKALEEEPKDLIGNESDEVSVDEGHIYFGWKKIEKKYRMVDG